MNSFFILINALKERGDEKRERLNEMFEQSDSSQEMCPSFIAGDPGSFT